MDVGCVGADAVVVMITVPIGESMLTNTITGTNPGCDIHLQIRTQQRIRQLPKGTNHCVK
jgi:hypothetical protein